MKFPNKVIPYNESVISKFPVILDALQKQDCSVLFLYKKCSKHISGISEFMDVLDCLFVLGKVEFYPEGGTLHYVEGNKM